MPRRNNGPRLRFLEKRGAYYIVWSERGRSRERSTGTASLAEAQEALGEFLQLQPGRVGPRDPSEIFVTDVLADYAQERDGQVMAPVRMACAIAALTPFWQGRAVQDVTRATCAAYAKSRGRYFIVWTHGDQLHRRCAFTSDLAAARDEVRALANLPAAEKLNRAPGLTVGGATLEFRPLSAGSIRRELTTLRAAINAAHREGRLTRPVAVELPQPPPAKERFLTRAEAARLLKAAREEPRSRLHLPLFILLGLYTGRRKEAILSLRWPSVEVRAGGLVDFRVSGQRESKKRRGRIQVPRRLLVHLRNARKRGTDLGHVVNDGGEAIGDIKRSFQSACERAGLTGVTPHTLRHTCATWLMQAGVDKWKAAGYLAMSLDTLERVYGHHHPDHDGGAGDTFSRRPHLVRATGVSGGAKPRLVVANAQSNQ